MEACPTCDNEYEDLVTHLNESYPSHLPDSWNTCNVCDKWFKKPGTHWSTSSCSYPNIPDKIHDIITGILMGDGWVDRDKNNPRVSISVIKENYVRYLDERFGNLSSGIYLDETGTKNAHRKGDDPSNYNDIYRMQTICHPELDRYSKWYSSGEKVWPETIDLTSSVLKHWYVCDGHYKDTSGDDYITISMSNERKNTEKIEEYFNRKGLPVPSWQFGTSYLNGNKIPRCIARWTVDESEKLFEYMGESVPGFEYKWKRLR